MFADPWLWATTLAGLGTLFAGIAARTIREYYHHELERYCRRRGREERYQEIAASDDDTLEGVEALKWVCVSTMLVCGSTFWLNHVVPTPVNLAAIAAIASISVLALTTWIPLAVAEIWAAPFLYRTWPVWRIIGFAAWPLTAGNRIAVAMLRRLAGHEDSPEDDEEDFEDEIRSIVNEGMQEGLINEYAGDMIDGVIELSDSDVADIMTPRSQVDAVDSQWPWEQVLEFVVANGRTRYPVYRDSLNEIIGIIYVKDLMAELIKPEGERRTELKGLLRNAWFTLRTRPLTDLLREFLHSRIHLAVVRDEYGAVEGVVTIEDVLEEIVGEIHDESDQDGEAEFKVISPSATEALGVVHVDDLNDHLGLNLPDDDDYNTVGGLIISRLGRIPRVNDSIVSDGVRITVLEADRRKVARVLLERLPE